MAINVAGTNAIGDYLVSRITNTRILMGEAAPTIGPSSVPAATPANQLSPAQLQQQLADSRLANTAELFGAAGSAAAPFPAAALAPAALASASSDRANIGANVNRLA